MLLDAEGADANIANYEGVTAIDMAEGDQQISLYFKS